MSRIDTYLEQLNDQQRKAVLENEAPLLVLAGAGSGKTRVITTKIVYALERLGLQPWQILAVTFTNKAAKEMRDRVSSMTDGVDLSAMQIRTFHSFGAWLLRRYGSHIGLESRFSIYDDQDSVTLLKSIYPKAKRVELARIARQISLAKDMRLKPDDEELKSYHWGNDFPSVYRSYEARLRKVGNVDFADLINRSIELLSPVYPVAEKLHARFRMILVDEYQDSNAGQFELLKRLVGKDTFICVVGDDDQSIYRFRGANVGHILSFPELYPGTKIVKLEQNYRSTSQILDVASAVIGLNTSRHRKVLWTANKGGPKPRLLRAADEREEALKIMNEIRKDEKYSETAIIYRTNAQSLTFETLLQKAHIPFRLIGALRFYDREEVKDALALLYLLLNREDEVHFRRIINKPSRGIGSVALDQIIALSEKEHIDLIDSTLRASQEGFLKGKGARGGRDFALLFDQAQKILEKGNSEALEYLIRESGLLSYFKEMDEKNSTEKIENIGRLITTVGEYAPGYDGLIEFVESLTLDPTTLGNFDPSKGNGVSLITMHNTKGLEFDRVFITGMEENLFPSRSSESEEEIEEERRLFYVGVTRARRELFFTTCQRRMIWGKTMYQMPSRFLDEIPGELIEEVQSVPAGGTVSRGRQKEVWGQRRDSQRSGGYTHPNILKTVSSFQRDRQKVTAGGSFSAGKRVYHDTYGEGEVQKVTMVRGNELVEVRFLSGSSKTFFASSGVLELVSG